MFESEPLLLYVKAQQETNKLQEGNFKHPGNKIIPNKTEEMQVEDYDFLEEIMCTYTEYSFNQISSYNNDANKVPWQETIRFPFKCKLMRFPDKKIRLHF